MRYLRDHLFSGGAYSTLLLSLVVVGLFYPVLDLGQVGVTFWHLAMWIAMIVAVRVCAQRRADLVIAVVLLALVVALGIVDRVLALASHEHSPELLVGLAAVLHAVFFAVVGRVILVRVLAAGRVTPATILGASCFYVILGLMWAYVYLAIESFERWGGHGPAFALAGGIPEGDGTLLQTLLYYSFVTLTTLGYGDVVPTSSWARLFAGTEAIVGQLYLTVLVARLVGLHISQRDDEPA